MGTLVKTLDFNGKKFELKTAGPKETSCSMCVFQHTCDQFVTQVSMDCFDDDESYWAESSMAEYVKNAKFDLITIAMVATTRADRRKSRKEAVTAQIEAIMASCKAAAATGSRQAFVRFIYGGHYHIALRWLDRYSDLDFKFVAYGGCYINWSTQV